MTCCVDLIDLPHELGKLAALLDGEVFKQEWAGFFPSTPGRPAPPRLVAGLLYLQHAYRLSDEAVVARWVENPYCRHVIGEVFFQHRPLIDPSSLTRWRWPIGEEGVEWLLTQTIRAGRKAGAIDADSVKRVAVDTTVMEKAIAHPADARLYERARDQPVALAQEARVEPRQSYARLASRLVLQVGRSAHAKQFKHMRKALKKLKGYTGRIMRDLRRHLDDIPKGTLRDRIVAGLAPVSQLLHQQPKGSDKIHSLHEPEVDCISKGKARMRYGFGCRVSVATTLDESFVVGMCSFPGHPRDGHTLVPALEQVKILTDQRPGLAVVDRGHRVEATRVLISGTRRGLTPELVADLRRRSAIEAEIGHMQTDGRMSRCPLKGTIGDALFAVSCACGHNIRKILAHLGAWLALVIATILHAMNLLERRPQPLIAT